MARFYVSHARRDAPVANTFRDWLSETVVSSAISSTSQSSDLQDNPACERQAVEAVRNSDVVILICSRASILCRQCFAEYVAAQSSEKLIFAVLIEDVDDKLRLAEDILRFKIGEDGRDLVKLVSVLRAFERVGPKDFEWSSEEPPYPGLRAFRPDEAGVFFARSTDVGRVIERISSALVKRAPRLIALTGPTGSGLSSLMLAGVLPGIQRNRANVIALPPMRPRLRPLDAFAISLATALNRQDQWRAWVDELTDADADGLVGFLETRIGELREGIDAPDAEILLPVDQFEEIYHVSGEAQAQVFQAVLAAIMAHGLPMLTIAALCADDAGTFRNSRLAAFGFETIDIEPIPTDRYAELIRGPAERTGLQVEDGLVRAIEQDAGRAGGGDLSGIAYVLQQVHRDDRGAGVLTETTYRSYGDASSGQSPLETAVARGAETALELAEAHIEERQAVQQALVESLVGRNSRARPIKRPASLEAFPRETLEVIDQLTQAGLLTRTHIGDEHLVEMSSPAVLRLWWRLEQALRTESLGPEIIASRCTELERYDPPRRTWLDVLRGGRPGVRGSLAAVFCLGAVITLVSARSVEPVAIGPSPVAQASLTQDLRGSPLPTLQAELKPASSSGPDVARVHRPVLGSAWITPSVFAKRPTAPSRSKPRSDPRIALPPRHASGPAPSALWMMPTGLNHAPTRALQRPEVSEQPAAAIVGLKTLLALADRRRPKRHRSERLLLAVEALLHPEAWTLSSRQTLDLKRSILDDIYALSRPLSFRTHRDTVFSAALSPDGRTVVTASADRTARLWNLRTRTELRVLTGHLDDVHSATFSPDGARVATTSGDGTTRIWWTRLDAKPVVLQGHGGSVNRSAFGPSGARIVTASADGTVGVWDTVTGNRLKTFAGHRGTVWNAAFSADGKQIVSSGKDKTARIWHAQTGEPLATLKGHHADVMSAAFSPNGRQVATASRDGTIRLWDAGSGRELTVLRGHEDTVISALFSGDGGFLVSASFDGTVKIWDLAAGQALATLEPDGRQVWSAVFAPDGRSVLAASRDGTVSLWPVFLLPSDLVKGALSVAGRCLGAPARRALALPPGQPSWCRRLQANRSDDLKLIGGTSSSPGISVADGRRY
ncbi:MAG: TIR domain-containing protein [Methyloligellaceae bacterium]